MKFLKHRMRLFPKRNVAIDRHRKFEEKGISKKSLNTLIRTNNPQGNDTKQSLHFNRLGVDWKEKENMGREK